MDLHGESLTNNGVVLRESLIGRRPEASRRLNVWHAVVLMTPDCRSTSMRQRTTPQASSKSTSNALLASKRKDPTSTDRRPYQANLHPSRWRSLDASQHSSSSPLSVRAWSGRLNIAAVAAWSVANPAFVAFNMGSLRTHLWE